ncbi:hypothetical protein OBK16_11985 [Empedobacter falsenii]
MKYIKNTILLLTMSTCFTACNSRSESLKSLITKSINEDRVIDSAECEGLKEYIIKNKNQYNDLFVDDQLDENKFVEYINGFLINKLRNAEDVKLECQAQEKSIVNIYIENSGSMDGYINGNTIYKANLSDIIVQTRGVYGIANTNTFFVNSNAFKSDSEDIKSFISKLNVGNSEYKQGNTSSSELNETLKLILSKSNDSNISILLSDFIYSLAKGQNTQDGLGIGKSLTKDAYLQHLNKYNLSTLILKFNSDFNGRYYSYDNSVTNFNGKRPYYVLAIGNDVRLREFMKKIQLSQLNGFENSYYISNAGSFNPVYEVYDSKLNIGTSKTSRESNKNQIILDDVTLDNGVFKFTIAVDFSELLDQKIVLNPSNYHIEGDFKIASIDKRTDNFINSNFSSGTSNKVKGSKATHFITLESTQPNFDKKLSLQLTNNKPNWIIQSSTDNDSKISNSVSTTFGFNYFVDGIYEAYKLKNNNTNNDFLSLNFTLNK